MSRQAATPAATLSAVMLKNIDNQTIETDENDSDEILTQGFQLSRGCLYSRWLRIYPEWVAAAPGFGKSSLCSFQIG
jgi:hypothetical protein